MRPSSALAGGMRLGSVLLWVPHSGAAQPRDEALEDVERPTAIRKMSPDAGQKFFPHIDMAFASNSSSIHGRDDESNDMDPLLRERSDFTRMDEITRYTNASIELVLRPPFASHSTHVLSGRSQERKQKRDREAEKKSVLEAGGERIPYDGSGIAGYIYGQARRALAVLSRRDFACPSGTSSCDDIGYSDYCCGESETCVVVDDTGLGPVGCCPAGATCGGTVAQCPDPDTACPADLGGGCCIEGYRCIDEGCVAVDVLTITLTTSSRTITTTRTTTSATVPATTPPTATATTTSTTRTSSTSPTSTATTEPTTDAATSGTATAVAPTRPTDDSCPTGFYACSATYGGGCCQTGRDCQTTSCPPITYTTLVSNGLTIAVPVTAVPADATAEPSCADGWFLCGADAGPRAGCCPSGYDCGTVSCTITDGTTATVAKELPDQTKLGDDNGIQGWGDVGRGAVVTGAAAAAAVAMGGFLI